MLIVDLVALRQSTFEGYYADRIVNEKIKINYIYTRAQVKKDKIKVQTHIASIAG